MSYKPEVIADDTGTWSGNALRFATEKEAQTYVADLAMRWTLVRDTRVVRSDEPVNYAIVDGKLSRWTPDPSPRPPQPRSNPTMTNHDLDKATLAHFTGSEIRWRHGLVRGILYTDGAKYVADKGGAHWLLDIIALAQVSEPRVKTEPFQVWTLKVTCNTATLMCDDGDGNVVFSQHITFTDFPLDEITFWFQDGTIYLPSEH